MKTKKEKLLELFDLIGFYTENGTLDPNTEPVGPTEKEIGVLNDFEKICSCFISERKNEQEEISVKAKSLDEKLDEYQDLEGKYDILFSVIEAVNGLLWVSIKSRIRIPLDAEEIVLRKGFKIVASYEKKKSFHPCSNVIMLTAD